MEAMCKNLTLRLQRTGMKWDVDYAPGLRSLIAIREGRQWDHSWETRRVARRQNPRPNGLFGVSLDTLRRVGYRAGMIAG
jgi:hypothetical protein